MSFLPAVYVYFVLNRLFKSSSYTVKVIILSHTVFVSLSSPNSLLNPIIYCYRNKMFRSHARNWNEVQKLLTTSKNLINSLRDTTGV